MRLCRERIPTVMHEEPLFSYQETPVSKYEWIISLLSGFRQPQKLRVRPISPRNRGKSAADRVSDPIAEDYSRPVEGQNHSPFGPMPTTKSLS